MAHKGRKFTFHGAFGSKAKAKRHEHSAHCIGCFIQKRKIKKQTRYLVLSK